MSKKSESSRRKKRQRRRKHWKNEHHLLFPGAKWGQSYYGRKIRKHKYFRRIIPENTLHKFIHRDVDEIPLPPKKACEEAYYEFLRRYKLHLIDQRHDTLEMRLQLLIDLWKDYPETVKALKAQQRIAIKFYNNGRT